MGLPSFQSWQFIVLRLDPRTKGPETSVKRVLFQRDEGLKSNTCSYILFLNRVAIFSAALKVFLIF